MADKSVLQEFTINFDLDLSNVEKATQEVQKSISAIGAEYLPQLENMLNEVTQSVGELADTTALQTMIDNIKNGVEVTTGEVEKIADDTFTALSEVMESQGYLWNEKAKEWVKTATEAFKTIENEAKQTKSDLSGIFSKQEAFTIQGNISDFLPQLENMLNEVTQSVGNLVDTTALNKLISNIKNGVEVTTDEIIKVTDDTFTALSEVMEQNGLMWNEKTQNWVAIAKDTADKVEQVFNNMDLGKDLELSELENLLEQIKEISGGSFDTSEFEKALERIRNGADLTADELVALQEKMQEALKKAERLEKIKSIFSNIKNWFSDILIGGFGGFGILNSVVDTIQETFAFQGKNNGFFSQNDLKTAQEYQKSIAKINEFLGQIQKMIARFLLPVIATLSTLLIKTLDFIVKHHKTIMLFLGALAIALSGIIKAQLKILATQLKILAPYLKLAVVVAIIEDIYHYFKGWDSITGELVEKFPLLGTALEIIRPLIMGIFHTIEAITDFFKNPSLDNFIRIFGTLADTIAFQAKKIFDIFADAFVEIGEAWENIDWVETFNQLFAIDWWSEKLNNLALWFKDTFKKISDFFTEIFNSVFDWFKEKIEAITKPIKNLTKGITDKATGIKKSVSEKIEGFKNLVGFGDNTNNGLNTPLIPAYTTNTTSNDTTFNNTMNFTLNGVDERVAKSMSNDISRQINQYQSQVSSKGVK